MIWNDGGDIGIWGWDAGGDGDRDRDGDRDGVGDGNILKYTSPCA